ncbi:PH, RCC1 and FYVE domains-containing protein 1 [Sesamum angolense]|uniref:PH, RCC1 and FYVE domains-containing protein 1 n=1 Tax=Sesamum angolense TaxID=2727404 RepID=A0AAE2BZD0_9LAMI|nr:PH, RCC1 and FYVE domains-containing protein 1 [Sesamum angolense]
MADLQRPSLVDRDIDQAITALKKGAHLLKYGRRGKPKFCPFRISSAIFQRYPRPEKEYQSFSLIYSDRSLDLICKDKDEAEVWFAGLKALIARANYKKARNEARNESASSDGLFGRRLSTSSSGRRATTSSFSVEKLTSKTQVLEAKLARKSKQLKEMNARAADEAEKSKAAKEVIKSLTAQLKEMAERVPGEQLACSNLDANEQMASEISRPSNGSSVASAASPTSDSSENSSTLPLSNGTKVQGQKLERIIQDEPGVYITLVSLLNGVNELRRVRFSRKQFTEIRQRSGGLNTGRGSGLFYILPFIVRNRQCSSKTSGRLRNFQIPMNTVSSSFYNRHDAVFAASNFYTMVHK